MTMYILLLQAINLHRAVAKTNSSYHMHTPVYWALNLWTFMWWETNWQCKGTRYLWYMHETYRVANKTISSNWWLIATLNPNLYLFSWSGHEYCHLPSLMHQPHKHKSNILSIHHKQTLLCTNREKRKVILENKRSMHSRRMHNPQFYVSGKRPILTSSWEFGGWDLT